MDKDKCEFYPNKEQLEAYGPFCFAGSDVSGEFVCTKKYSDDCRWANELREMDNKNSR